MRLQTCGKLPKRQSARSSLALAGLREFEGRALNSRRKSTAATVLSIEQQTSDQIGHGNIKEIERGQSNSPRSFYQRKLLPRLKSDSEANPISRPEVRVAPLAQAQTKMFHVEHLF
ncbi:hypothetical protein RASY3_04580 [Ruminococcus albus SY3]|uniref:Uncharacterized protein n=1 Tax=Ruminococcus albus SY3 TaxID=1341156 RepID=A0A011UHC6_RUMAL|nr:hypothetical protein RASY3_04580 [Ruminococcus albus SY3]